MNILIKKLEMVYCSVRMSVKRCTLSTRLNHSLACTHFLPWSSIITRYVNSGKFHLALATYNKMQKCGSFTASRDALLALLKICTKLKDYKTGHKIHLRLVADGLLEKDSFIGSSLIGMYAKCGLIAKAQQLFNQLPFPDVVSWTALIAGYVEHSYCEEALGCFQQMQHNGVSPDVVTFLHTLKACAMTGAIDKGQEIHDQIKNWSLLEENLALSSILVDMYAKCGSLDKAVELFHTIQDKDIVLWTSLIAGYAEHGYNEEALKCFERMKLQCLISDSFTFACLLKACGSMRAMSKGINLHVQIHSRGLSELDIVLGNGLVGMYAKCNQLPLAHKLFEKLPIHDVVSWTALITGYAEHGCSLESLKCFYAMQIEGLSPNAVTYLGCLKVCTNTKWINNGHELHSQIVAKGLTNECLSNTLIDMYAKCGFLSSAHEIFDNLIVKDTVSWTALIAGYVEHGHGEAALQLFSEMKTRNVCPNNLTFVSILKACGSIGSAMKGLEIYDQMIKKGFVETELHVGTVLVDMFMRCNQLLEAHKTFGELPNRDVILWTTFISGHVDCGYYVEALKYFEQMQSESVSPDAVTLSNCLKACGRIGDVSKGGEIHMEIERSGTLERDFIIGTGLVDMYLKSGMVSKAQELFEKLPIQNTFSWTVMIAGYTEHGHFEEAFKSFQQMHMQCVLLNDITLIQSLNACGRAGAINKGKQIHAVIEAICLIETNISVCDALVDMYVKCSSVACANHVFERIPERYESSWNHLILGYVESGYNDEVLQLYKQMSMEGITPNAVTVLCALKGCRNGISVREVQAIHAQIESTDLLHRDPFIAAAVIDMYTKSGMFMKAQEICNHLSVKTVSSWTALITGYAEKGLPQEAIKCLKKMEFEGVSPNATTYVCILKACGTIGTIESVREIHIAIELKGLLRRDIELGNALIDVYAKCLSLDGAEYIFEKLPITSIVSWNSLLAGYARNGDVKKCVYIVSKMFAGSIKPDSVTFVVFLKLCTCIGLYTERGTYLDNLSKHFGMVTDPDFYSSKIRLMCYAGLLDKAISLINENTPMDSPVVWHSLLSACRTYMNVELGKQAFEHAMR